MKFIYVILILLFVILAAQIPQRGSKYSLDSSEDSSIEHVDVFGLGCKRKEEPVNQPEQLPTPKKPRLVFTDLQRRTLQAIFKV